MIESIVIFGVFSYVLSALLNFFYFSDVKKEYPEHVKFLFILIPIVNSLYLLKLIIVLLIWCLSKIFLNFRSSVKDITKYFFK